MDKFVLSTRKSLYKPIEIEIDEKIYHSKKLTSSLNTEIEKLDEKIRKGNEKACYESVNLLFGVDEKTLNKLDKREVRDILLFAKRKFVEIEAETFKKEATLLQKQLGIKQQATKVIPKNPKRSGGKT